MRQCAEMYVWNAAVCLHEYDLYAYICWDRGLLSSTLVVVDFVSLLCVCTCMQTGAYESIHIPAHEHIFQGTS